MSAKSARNCRKAFRWAHIKKSWASGAPKTPTENPAQPPLLRGGCAGGALLFRCGFPVCPHVCRGRVEVNLQRITDRASVLFSVRVVGLWFIHTFQRPRIPITADYCPHMLPHVRFPCQGPRRFACGAAAGAVAVGLTTVLPLALGAGCCLPRGVHSFRVPGLVVSRMRCKGIRAPHAGHAAYVTCADSQTTGCSRP